MSSADPDGRLREPAPHQAIRPDPAVHATRVDVGLNVRKVASTARLERSGRFNAMVSHRVQLEKKADVDRELIAWLKQAYLEA